MNEAPVFAVGESAIIGNATRFSSTGGREGYGDPLDPGAVEASTTLGAGRAGLVDPAATPGATRVPLITPEPIPPFR
jgi:hypothetical protein